MRKLPLLFAAMTLMACSTEQAAVKRIPGNPCEVSCRAMLRVYVTAEGVAEVIQIKESSGSKKVDESLVRTVEKWKFIPAKKNETSIASWVLVPIVFKTED